METTLDFLSIPARQAAVIDEQGHRPWPLPDGRWIMAQTWDDLLFAHWRVSADALRPFVPAGLSIDEFDGTAWLAITPFVISGFRLRGTLPLPGLSTFPELNVRTYVTAEDKPGIWFFSLDTSSQIAVEGARRLYKLPYFHAEMSVDRSRGWIDYASSRRQGAHRPFVFTARYRPENGVAPAEPGSLDYFLTERYCLYAEHSGELYRAEIHHPPWPLRRAEARIELNTMPPDGLSLPEHDPMLHFSPRQDVLIWALAPLAV